MTQDLTPTLPRPAAALAFGKNPSLIVRLMVALACGAATGSSAERPNFLLIFTDDHGYGDVSTYGPSQVRTPHIDRIAAEGMLFTSLAARSLLSAGGP